LLEVQAVDVADSIAYDAHDADDSLECGWLQLDQLLDVPLWQEARGRIDPQAGLNQSQLRRAIVHEVIDWQVSDVIECARRDIESLGIGSVADVRAAPVVVRPSLALAQKKSRLEDFLFDKVYRHSKLLSERQAAQQALHKTFDALLREPQQLPPKFRRIADRDGLPRAVGDYLAGMTDRFAFDEYERLVTRRAHW
jgi:dGTPase